MYMLGEWLPFTSPGYPSTHTGPATWTPNLENSVSVSLIPPLFSVQTFFSLICLSSLAFTIHLISLSISLVHPSFSPPFCHSSLPCPFFFFILFPLFSLFPSCSTSPTPIPCCLLCLKFPPCGYCWLHICCGVNFTSVNGWQERLITPCSPSPWLWAFLMNKYINNTKNTRAKNHLNGDPEPGRKQYFAESSIKKKKKGNKKTPHNL